MTSTVSLTPAQEAVAVEMLAFGAGRTAHAVSTLAGYAGVGKTTVVAHVVQALARDAVSIVVLAPTHKALAVLADKLDGAPVETMTLHSALALKVRDLPDGQQEVQDAGEPGALRDFELAIVDEASMVSEAMFATALAKRGRCRILFVGDPAQLPPVDNVRGSPQEQPLSPAFGGQVPLHWQLTEVVRQAAGNPIIRLATAARECISEASEFGLRTLSSTLVAGDDEFMAVAPGGVLAVAELVASAMQHGQDTRALAWDNASVQAVNAHVHAMLHPGLGDYPAGTPLMAQEGFVGTTTDGREARYQVANSALLTVRGCSVDAHPREPERAAYRLLLEDDGGTLLQTWVAQDQRQWQADISECFADYRRLKLREQAASHGGERNALREQAKAASRAGWDLKARFAPLRYAYAMTVHKSQGSTFDAVVLDWTSFARCRDVQLRNRLAYVALTRTRRFAVVCA